MAVRRAQPRALHDRLAAAGVSEADLDKVLLDHEHRRLPPRDGLVVAVGLDGDLDHPARHDVRRHVHRLLAHEVGRHPHLVAPLRAARHLHQALPILDVEQAGPVVARLLGVLHLDHAGHLRSRWMSPGKYGGSEGEALGSRPLTCVTASMPPRIHTPAGPSLACGVPWCWRGVRLVRAAVGADLSRFKDFCLCALRSLAAGRSSLARRAVVWEIDVKWW